MLENRFSCCVKIINTKLLAFWKPPRIWGFYLFWLKFEIWNRKAIHPSIHPSWVHGYSRWSRDPQTPLSPCTWGKQRCSPDTVRHNISSVSCVFPGVFPRGDMPEKSHLGGVQETSHSEPTLNGQTPHPICKGEPSHISEEAHSCHFYPWSYSSLPTARGHR